MRKVTRREFVVATLGGLAAAGCAASTATTGARPKPYWPSQVASPRTATSIYTPPVAPPVTPYAPVTPTPTPVAPPAAQAFADSLRMIPRSAWSQSRLNTERLNPIGGIDRVTLHHEGWEVINFTDVGNTVDRLRHIQRYHMKDRQWGDIGYHFIIDRAGRIWEGRPLGYQGAHVLNHNERNVGVMVLGNFDQQQPSSQQLGSVRTVITQLLASYRVPVQRVYTHQELNPTNCPGRAFQPQVVAMRRGGYFG